MDSYFRNPSQDEAPAVKERSRRKLSLKSRKEKGIAKYVEEDLLKSSSRNDIGRF